MHFIGRSACTPIPETPRFEMRFGSFCLLAVAAYASLHGQDSWVEDFSDADALGACGMSLSEAPPENQVPKDKMGKCPVCDLDCDTEAALANGEITDVSGLVEEGSDKLIIYGRKTCGMTTRFQSQLDAAKIAYSFMSVDAREGSAEMWPKLQKSGLDLSRGVGLPVVDVYGTMAIRPSVTDVKSAAPRSAPAPPPAPAPAKSNPAPAPATKSAELVVYGRNTCGMTRSIRSQLDAAGV